MGSSFVCSHCGREFSSEGKLAKHDAIYHDKREYSCNQEDSSLHQTHHHHHLCCPHSHLHQTPLQFLYCLLQKLEHHFLIILKIGIPWQ